MIASTSSNVVVERRGGATISRAIRSAKRSSPYSRSARASRRRSQVLTISARGQLLRRGPCACPAARRRRRRSRARACRPASRTCRGPGRRGPRSTPSSTQLLAGPWAKSARMKRVSARDLGGELGERLLGQRVAVDRDQRARPGRGGRRRGARGRRAPSVQSTAIWPGCGSSASISSPARTGTCVRGMSSRMAK